MVGVGVTLRILGAAALFLVTALTADRAALACPSGIEASNRTPLPALVLSPSGEAGRVGTSELLRALDRALSRHGRLVASPIEAAAVSDCHGRLGCIVEALPAGTRRALVVSDLSAPNEPDLVFALLVDVPRALLARDHAVRGRAEWQADLEAEIDASAVRVRSERVELARPEDALRFFETLIARWAALEPAELGPAGAVRIVGAPEGLELELDDLALGRTQAGGTLLCGLAAGGHRVRVRGPEGAWSAEIEVAPALTATLAAALPEAARFRTGLRVAGLGAAAAGVAFGALALLRHSDQVTYCAHPPNGAGSCPGRGFSTLDDGGPGPLVGPLGYSLVLTGAVWGLGPLLEDGEPVGALLAGALAGALAYGISAAVH
jgi:hypothetical protein